MQQVSFIYKKKCFGYVARLLLGDGKYLLQAIAVLNSTVGETTSKSVLTQLNELSQYNSVENEFAIVGEEVSYFLCLALNCQGFF